MVLFFDLCQSGLCPFTPTQRGKNIQCVGQGTLRSTAPKPCCRNFWGVGVPQSGKGNSLRLSISTQSTHTLPPPTYLMAIDYCCGLKRSCVNSHKLFLVKTAKILCNMSSVPWTGTAWARALWNSVELHLHQKRFWSKVHSELCRRCLATW